MAEKSKESIGARVLGFLGGLPLAFSPYALAVRHQEEEARLRVETLRREARKAEIKALDVELRAINERRANLGLAPLGTKDPFPPSVAIAERDHQNHVKQIARMARGLAHNKPDPFEHANMKRLDEDKQMLQRLAKSRVDNAIDPPKVTPADDDKITAVEYGDKDAERINERRRRYNLPPLEGWNLMYAITRERQRRARKDPSFKHGSMERMVYDKNLLGKSSTTIYVIASDPEAARKVAKLIYHGRIPNIYKNLGEAIRSHHDDYPSYTSKKYSVYAVNVKFDAATQTIQGIAVEVMS